MDLHAAQIQGFFDIPVDNMLGSSVLIPYIAGKFGVGTDDTVIVSPDLGSVTRARKFTQKLDMPLAIIDKRRPKANVSEVMNIIGNVEGKKCILVDDLIDTAGTLVHAADALVERGGATEVYACASHGVLSGPAIERIQNSPIKELTILDTIPLTNDKKLDKINVLPVAPVFTEAIARIYEKLRFRPCSIKILHGKELLHGCSSSFCIYFLHRPAGGHELRKRVRPFRAAAFFQHRLSGGHELRRRFAPDGRLLFSTG